MTLEGAVAAIRKWNDESLRAHGIMFRETVLAERAGAEDYTVAYEAVFESEDLKKARLELWVTDIGHVGVGFEKHHRLAKRLGCRPRGRSTFLSGHEPDALSEDAVRGFLDAVSKGQVHVTYVNLFGLILDERCFMEAADQATLLNAGYDGDWWIHRPPEKGLFRNLGLRRVVRYEPW